MEGLPPVPDLSRDSRTNPHKVLVQLGGGGLRRDSLGGPLALDHLPHVAEDGGRTLPPHPAGNILPGVTADSRFYTFIQSEESWGPAIACKEATAPRHESQGGVRDRGR